ncbi:MAG: hypothetical protein CTY35_06470 [Methylotenera sp.]|nr:MAG: hypothetical protein CTY35_06470 [Methylotenera sp.]
MEYKLAVKDENLEDVLTISEIKVGLDAFTEAKWIKLGRAANNLCRGLPFEGADLLHIVICKALEGKRKCPRNLPIEVFIYGAMESLVDAYIKKRKSDPMELTIHAFDNEDILEQVDILHSNIDTPEEEVIATQTLQIIKELFEGDERSSRILVHQMDNLSPTEIQELMNLTPVEYASALKAIRRKYEKLGI